jgi:hypothetical protein
MAPRRVVLLLAAIGTAWLGAGAAHAQTLIVKNAPPGAPIELMLNAAAVGSGKADAEGGAKVAVTRPPGSEAGDIDAYLFVDTCGERRRVSIVASGEYAAPLEAGCRRQEIPGLFLVRPISTLVVDVGAASPTVLLRQGPYDPSAAGRASWGTAPKGLMVYAGTGFTAFGSPTVLVCGNVSNCSGDESGLGLTLGADYWFTPIVAATAGYLKAGDMSAAGIGSGYLFTNALEAEVLSVGGKAGFPTGPIRIYGKGGLNYQRSLFSTTEAIREVTITVDGQTEVIPGGVQTLTYGTSGWSWQFGAGLEVWFSDRVGTYAEFEWAKLKGTDRGDGEAAFDDSLLSLLFGVKVRLWR